MKTRAFPSLICAGLAMSLLVGCYNPPPAAPAAPPGYSGAASSEPNTADYAPGPPPAPLVESVPPAPGYGASWQPGHWAWNGDHWVWILGHYAYPPASATTWVPGHWQESSTGYTWVAGHWE